MSDAILVSGRNDVEITADIIAAYVSRNHVQPTELPTLIASVHAALTALGNGTTAEPASPEKATAAQIKKSISSDGLISFEDGKTYKTLKRHLTLRGLTPEAYRAKWGLSPDYPMTAASYSAQRSALAQALGLGQQRRKTAPAPEPKVAPTNDAPSEKPKRLGRPRKVKEEA